MKTVVLYMKIVISFRTDLYKTFQNYKLKPDKPCKTSRKTRKP